MHVLGESLDASLLRECDGRRKQRVVLRALDTQTSRQTHHVGIRRRLHRLQDSDLRLEFGYFVLETVPLFPADNTRP